MIRKVWIAALLLGLLIQSAQAQLPPLTRAVIDTTMPGDVRGERIASLIRTINANDRDVLAKFLQEECTERFRDFAPLDAHVGAFGRVLSESGGVDFFGMRNDIPVEVAGVVVILKDRKPGLWHDVRVMFDDGKETLVAGVRFGMVKLPWVKADGVSTSSGGAKTETPVIRETPQATDDSSDQETSR